MILPTSFESFGTVAGYASDVGGIDDPQEPLRESQISLK